MKSEPYPLVAFVDLPGETKPFTDEESRRAYRTPNPEFDAVEHNCASLPKRLSMGV